MLDPSTTAGPPWSEAFTHELVQSSFEKTCALGIDGIGLRFFAPTIGDVLDEVKALRAEVAELRAAQDRAALDAEYAKLTAAWHRDRSRR